MLGELMTTDSEARLMGSVNRTPLNDQLQFAFAFDVWVLSIMDMCFQSDCFGNKFWGKWQLSKSE